MASFSVVEDIPPSPLRWSLIPFNILDEWEISEKRYCSRARSSRTHISDLPDAILAVIFSLIVDPRTRNSTAVVCTNWYSLERATRKSLRLRGSVSDLFLIPRSFQAVEQLDLSQCWPWGNSLSQCLPGKAVLVGQVLKQAFPRVRNMTIYARDARDIDVVACFWPELQSLKLVRWHQRPVETEESSGFGMEFRFLMQNCRGLRELDLSQFYCWTEDIPPALDVEPSVSLNLRSLNLLKVSGEGFKALELEAITCACANLEELRILVVFDPRFLDFVGDSALVQVATGCSKLAILHLVDSSAFEEVRGDPNEGFSSQDANITTEGLISLFQGLPLLEDLALVLGQNVRNSGQALEKLAISCKRLRSLRLGHFHGVCLGSQAAGVALCSGLSELEIKNSADLNDSGLLAIASGCRSLRKLGLHSCKEVSKHGCRALTSRLSQTLIDIEISCCLQMDAVDTLWALHPIQATIEHLHLDCIWNDEIIGKIPEGDGLRLREHLDCRWKGDIIAKIPEDNGLRSRELAEGHKPSTLATIDLWGFETEKGVVSSPAKGCTVMDSTIGAKHGNAGGAVLECEESSRNSHSLNPKFNDSGIQGDRGGQCSTSLGPMEKLKGDSCDGWLSLSRTSSSKDVPEGVLVTGETWKERDNHRLWNRRQGLDQIGSGISEVLSYCQKSCVMSSLDSDAARFPLEHSGDGVKRTAPGDLNGKGCEWETAAGNRSLPATVDESFMLDLFTSSQENPANSSVNTLFQDLSRPRCEQAWSSLKSLSLWIPVGEVVSLLPTVGLKACPLLQEIRLRVEGDSRICPKPRMPDCGVATFARYPAFSKLLLDCSETIGYALSVPPGQMELGLWERWFLQGVQTLSLSRLEYWPPQDRDANRRGLTLPSTALISHCPSLRVLVLHGTAHEHFLRMFLNIPNLRDVQVKIDYYPAPEELHTEMRADAFRRFEANLASRGFPD